MEWQPIETAPKDGTRVLVSWPLRALDEDGFATGKLAGRETFVSYISGGYWVDPEALNAVGEWFGDDDGFTDAPDLWMPLPPPPVHQEEEK